MKNSKPGPDSQSVFVRLLDKHTPEHNTGQDWLRASCTTVPHAYARSMLHCRRRSSTAVARRQPRSARVKWIVSPCLAGSRRGTRTPISSSSKWRELPKALTCTWMRTREHQLACEHGHASFAWQLIVACGGATAQDGWMLQAGRSQVERFGVARAQCCQRGDHEQF